MLREALTPYAGVEGFDHRVVGRLSRAAEAEPHLVRPGPVLDHARRELRAVIAVDHGREAAAPADLGQDVGDVLAAEVHRGFECEAFARVRIEHRQYAQLLT